MKKILFGLLLTLVSSTALAKYAPIAGRAVQNGPTWIQILFIGGGILIGASMIKEIPKSHKDQYFIFSIFMSYGLIIGCIILLLDTFYNFL